MIASLKTDQGMDGYTRPFTMENTATLGQEPVWMGQALSSKEAAKYTHIDWINGFQTNP